MNHIEVMDEVLTPQPRQRDVVTADLIKSLRAQTEEEDDVEELAGWWGNAWQLFTDQEVEYPVDFIRDEIGEGLPSLPLNADLEAAGREFFREGIPNSGDGVLAAVAADLLLDALIEALVTCDGGRDKFRSVYPLIDWLDRELKWKFDDRFVGILEADKEARDNWTEQLCQGPPDVGGWFDEWTDEARIRGIKNRCQDWSDLSNYKRELKLWGEHNRNLRPSMAEVRRLELVRRLDAQKFYRVVDKMKYSIVVNTVAPWLGLEQDGEFLLEMLRESPRVYEDGGFQGEISGLLAVRTIFKRAKGYVDEVAAQRRIRDVQGAVSEREETVPDHQSIVERWFEDATTQTLSRSDGGPLALRLAERTSKPYEYEGRYPPDNKLEFDPRTRLFRILTGQLFESGVDSEEAFNYFSESLVRGDCVARDEVATKLSPSAYVTTIELHEFQDENGEGEDSWSPELWRAVKSAFRSHSSFVNNATISLDKSPSIWLTTRTGWLLLAQEDVLGAFRDCWSELSVDRDRAGFQSEASTDRLRGSVLLLETAMQGIAKLLANNEGSVATELWRETFRCAMQLWLSAPNWAKAQSARPMHISFAYGFKIFEDDFWSDAEWALDQIATCPWQVLRTLLLLRANGASTEQLLEVNPLEEEVLKNELAIRLEKEVKGSARYRQDQTTTVTRFAEEFHSLRAS